jgi:hypothetical protein
MADGRYSSDAEAKDPKGGRAAGHIFILRLWEEQAGSGVWTGRVQHVLRGEARSFSGLGTLAEFLAEMLPRPHAESSSELGGPPAPQGIPDSRAIRAPETLDDKNSQVEEKGY